MWIYEMRRECVSKWSLLVSATIGNMTESAGGEMMGWFLSTLHVLFIPTLALFVFFSLVRSSKVSGV